MKTTESLSQDSQCLSQDLNCASSNYESRVGQPVHSLFTIMAFAQRDQVKPH
jgi:hypothetical protein